MKTAFFPKKIFAITEWIDVDDCILIVSNSLVELNQPKKYAVYELKEIFKDDAKCSSKSK